jgi:DNA-binding transcriptional MerR regulator
VEKKLYTIGEIAKMSGITIRTLRYYDSINLLHPIKHPKNGYRYYDKASINKLQLILGLKSMDFSLNDIRKYMVKENIDMITMLKYQKEDVLKKISLLNDVNKKIDFVLERINEKESYVDDIFSIYESIELMNHNEIAKKFVDKDYDIKHENHHTLNKTSHEELTRLMITLFNDRTINIEEEVLKMKEDFLKFIKILFGEITHDSIQRTITFFAEILKSSGDIDVSEQIVLSVVYKIQTILIEGEK